MRPLTSAVLAFIVMPALFALSWYLLLYAEIRHGMPYSEKMQVAVMLAAAGAGTFFVWRSVPPTPARILIAGGYIAGMLFLQFWMALFVSCAWGDCL